MRYALRIDPLWRALLLIGGARPQNSWAEIHDDAIEISFGALFHERLPRRYVVSTAEIDWPWWRGIGWRGWGDRVGLIGSTHGVVEVRLSDPVRVAIGIPWPFAIRRVAISLEDPAGFIEAAHSRGTSAAEP